MFFNIVVRKLNAKKKKKDKLGFEVCIRQEKKQVLIFELVKFEVFSEQSRTAYSKVVVIFILLTRNSLDGYQKQP